MTQISIIIPVYNTATYVAECIQSVITQTFTHIEIIVIDDCSTDNSADIIKSLSGTDPRILLIEQEANRGAGAARNRGIQEASGEYILFLDSDDYLTAPVNLEHLYNKAMETGSDIVLFMHKILNMDTGTIHDMLSDSEKQFWASTGRNNYISVSHGLENLFDLLIAPAYPWNKFIKRTLLMNNTIRCTETFCHNDLALSWKCMMTAKSFGLLPETIIMHRHAPTLSQLTNDKSKRRLDLFRALDEVNLFFKKKNMPVTHWLYYLKFKWNCFFWGMMHISPQYRRIFTLLMKKDILSCPQDIRKLYFRNFVKGVREKFKIILLHNSPLLYTLLFHIFKKRTDIS